MLRRSSRSRQSVSTEIKRSLAPVLSKGFYMACEDLNIREQYVVYPGHESYPLSKTAQVVSLHQAMGKIADETS